MTSRFVEKKFDAETFGVWDTQDQSFVAGLASAVYRAYDRKCALWYAMECNRRGYSGPDRF